MTDYESEFAAHNSHFEGQKNFKDTDPDLSKLKSHSFIHYFDLLNHLPTNTPGIYTLCGAHLVGKTTLLKSWMHKLMESGIPAANIAYLPGQHIQDYHVLQTLLQKQLASMPTEGTLYLILDEANSIRDWPKSILPLLKADKLNRVVLIIAGPDNNLQKDADDHFPNRMNIDAMRDFHLYPLTFRETIILKLGNTQNVTILFNEFNNYLLHGGFLIAINEVQKHGHVQDKTLSEYADWIIKETIHRGKQEPYLREILGAVIKHYNSQITWNVLAQELSIDHPKTIGDYFAMLESMDAVFVQHALIEDTLQAAPKKARKLMFTDPFIFHAINAKLSKERSRFASQIKANLDNPDIMSKLVKTCAITQYQRYFPTFYIKGEGEVDLAYVFENNFWPIEITWAGQIRAKDLKQVLKYQNGRILTKTDRSGIIQHIRTEPLPIALWQIEGTNPE